MSSSADHSSSRSSTSRADDPRCTFRRSVIGSDRDAEDIEHLRRDAERRVRAMPAAERAWLRSRLTHGDGAFIPAQRVYPHAS